MCNYTQRVRVVARTRFYLVYVFAHPQHGYDRLMYVVHKKT